MKLKLRFLLLIIFAGSNAFSQIQYSGSINLEGYYSNQDELPFWFYSNQRGRVSEETNVTGWINGKLDYEISQNSSIELGGGLLYQDAYDDEISIDELIYPAMVPQSKYLPERICPKNFSFLFIKVLIASVI